MEIEPRKKTLLITAAVLITTAAFVLGAFFGYTRRPEVEKITSVLNKEVSKPEEVDFSAFWKAWRIVEEKYADRDKIDRQKMVWGAIEGALKSLEDPYTTFFPPEEKKLFDSEIKGNFEGVGMEIGIRQGILTVVAPIKGTPAYRAGIKAGDKILKIDEKDAIDITTDEAVRLIRGERGTSVTLILLSDEKSEPREVKVVRDVIQIPVIDTEIRDGGIFIIHLYNFSEGSTRAFQNALREMHESGSDKLVLDLRNNPGGFLEAAVDISSWFLETGKIVVREKFSDGSEALHRSRGYFPFGNIPMVILVNGGSASASEIVAGALQDHGAAKLIGEKTFGKGSVQELVPVTRDTSLKVTIAHWLTPNGRNISENGLEPDVEVRITEDDEAAGKDPQLQKALEILRNTN